MEGLEEEVVRRRKRKEEVARKIGGESNLAMKRNGNRNIRDGSIYELMNLIRINLS